MPKWNVLWAVVDVIEANDGEAALTELRNRLAQAGLNPYEGTWDLVPPGYQLAMPAEDEEEQ